MPPLNLLIVEDPANNLPSNHSITICRKYRNEYIRFIIDNYIHISGLLASQISHLQLTLSGTYKIVNVHGLPFNK